MSCVIIAGDPFDGYELLGPFESPDDARDWIARNGDEDTPDWWIISLNAANDDTKDKRV